MIIHIEICDCCGHIQRALPLHPFSSGGKDFEICAACLQQPFRVFDTTAKRRDLRARIEALIETERKLEPQA